MKTLLNVIWLVLSGFWLFLGFITIIGIPLGIANFKLIPVALMPLGKQIVDIP
ncbi:MAG: hypothetical protein H7311_09495 [Ramlibacter sp.]|nr:hypothetical protein [Cryobacterium sp.]